MLAAAHLLLFDDEERLLMLRRANTGYEDGKWSLPAGHIDRGESAVAAAVREAKEELGIDVQPSDVAFQLVMHKADPVDAAERIDFFFTVRTWSGVPTNREPHKCDGLSWFPIEDRPELTIEYIDCALDEIAGYERYVEFGW